MTAESKTDIGRIISKSPGKLFSGEALAKRLGISRAAVWKSIRSLKRQGWDIVSAPNKGYRLKIKPDLIDVEQLRKWAANSNSFVRALKYVSATGSTQDEAKKVADNPLVESLLVIAEEQSDAYGRLRRKWIAGRGGLWFSLLLKPHIVPQKAAALTLIFCLSCAEVLEKSTGFGMSVKWPNDVYCKGRKICGILTELSAEMDAAKWVVLGAGINVNNKIAPAIKDIAVSASAAAGSNQDRTVLLIRLLDNFKNKYSAFLKSGFEGFKTEYIRRLFWLGERVKVKTAFGKGFRGRIKGVDDNGFLILSLKSGEQLVASGDVVKNQKKNAGAYNG